MRSVASKKKWRKYDIIEDIQVQKCALGYVHRKVRKIKKTEGVPIN